MSATTNTSGSTRPAAPRNRTHYLYVAVIVAVGLGIAVGLIAPDVRRRAQAARPRRSSR